LNIFINEPKLLNDLPLLGTFDLEFNLGLFIVNNAKISNYYIARDLEGIK